jgi:hypothetical protein
MRLQCKARVFNCKHRCHYSNFPVVENLCAPDVDAELYKQPEFVLDHHQIESIWIELLERGLNPGSFSSDDTADPELIEGLMKFQSEYQLPVTGRLDAVTLDALSIRVQKPGASILPELTRLAKPSQ